ncbi:MAG TPA: hypothetical protein VJP77_06200, partial [Planctomycetota bacterium]|nr:hypothetical protein [Planctomycetota bacterium]
ALLAGKVVLLIGGQRRAFEADRLQRDLGLAELRWISTTAHRSIAPLEEEIWKPDVALVVTAPRWSDHAFIELKQTAQQAGKPFLQLPGGYGTNQVAYQVMRQVSGQLGAAR